MQRAHEVEAELAEQLQSRRLGHQVRQVRAKKLRAGAE